MVFLATLWAAGLNLLLLLVALAWTPAFWSDPARWLGRLPWDNFGAELASLLSMQAVAAGAIWALWLCVSAVLSAGALVACALLKLRATPAAPTPPPPPRCVGDVWQFVQQSAGFAKLWRSGRGTTSAISARVIACASAKGIGQGRPGSFILGHCSVLARD